MARRVAFPIRCRRLSRREIVPVRHRRSGIFTLNPIGAQILGAREEGSVATVIMNSIKREGEVPPRDEAKDSIDVLTCRLEAPAS